LTIGKPTCWRPSIVFTQPEMTQASASAQSGAIDFNFILPLCNQMHTNRQAGFQNGGVA
jgi:hypothetical protein